MAEAPKFIVAAVLVLGLSACSTVPREGSPVGTVASPSEALECVQYARERSGIEIYGDAWTWWDKARGRYALSPKPETGAVMVLAGYAGDKRAHLAVVTQTDSPRIIRVDHANWLNDGRIYLDDPVADVSADNDWSEVRIYNLRDGGWGTRIYKVQGFILPRPPDPGTFHISRN